MNRSLEIVNLFIVFYGAHGKLVNEKRKKEKNLLMITMFFLETTAVFILF